MSWSSLPFPLYLSQWSRASASQAKDHIRCPSRWYANKILKIPQPETEAMRRGKRLHGGLESWEATGDVSYLEDMTMPIVDMGIITVPVAEDQIERKVELNTRVVPIVGYIDLELPDERTVIDHKTTSDWKYIKTPSELSWDPQAIIYCYDALERWGGDEPITFRHIYYKTRGARGCRTAEVQLEPADIRSRFKTLVDRLATMAEHALLPWDEVPVNTDACRDYGGCPFRSTCSKAGKFGGPLDCFDDQTTTTGETTMTYAELLKARAAAARGETPPQPAEPVDPTPEPLAVTQHLIEGGTREIVAASVNPPDGTPEFEAVELEQKTKKTRGTRYGDQLVSGMAKKDCIRAWDDLFSRLPASEALAKGPTLLCYDTETKCQKAKVKVGDLRSDITAMLAAKIDGMKQQVDSVLSAKLPEVVVSYASELNKDDGRGPGSSELEDMDLTPDEMFGAGMAVGAEMERRGEYDDGRGPGSSEPYTPEQAAHINAGEVIAKANKTLYCLYIGCHPHGRQVAYLDELVGVIQETVAKEAGADHYQMIQYGEGPKRVASMLSVLIRTGKMSLPNELVVDRRNPCGDAALDVLIPLYRRAGGLITERLG